VTRSRCLATPPSSRSLEVIKDPQDSRAQNNTMSVSAAELDAARRKMEERTCRVGAPRGPCGIVEKVFKGRATGTLRCKVLMDSGAIRYLDEIDVYLF
jgi:hypothetical protein